MRDALSNYLEKEQRALSKISSSKNLTSKNKSAFLRNSRFEIFHENKDVPLLLELITAINTETPSETSTLHTIITRLQSKISNLIPRLIRSVRLELKEEEVSHFTTFTKDFIELELTTQRGYFALFGDLFVFLVRLLEYKEREEPDGNYDYLQSIHLSTTLVDHLHDLQRGLYGLLLEIFEEHNEQSLQNLEALVVDIVMDLLRTEVKFETTLEYTTFRNPVILFLVLQSINPSDQSFKSESVISKMTSKIIYASRLFLLGSIWTKELQQNQNPDSLFDVAEYYRTNLPWVTVSHGHNYFEEVGRIRRYLLKALKERVSENKPIIDLGLDTYLVYEKKYTFRGICELHQRLEKDLLDLLFSRLILLPQRDLPRLNLADLEDNSSISTEGYYLADNPSFIPTKEYIRRQLVDPNSPIYRSLFSKGASNGTRHWRRTTIVEFFRARQAFIKLFLLAAHLASGSPLRGTEWEYTTYRNIRGTD
ncbi:uncharacterized protein PV07_12813, partial [Cladophialophora immunda]